MRQRVLHHAEATRVRRIGDRSALPTVTALVIAVTVAACSASSILSVQNPSRTEDGDLNNPALASLLLNGVIEDFACAFSGYIIAAGMHGDEFNLASGLSDYTDTDRRTELGANRAVNVVNCDSGTSRDSHPGIWVPVQVARAQGDRLAKKLEGWTDAEVSSRQSKIATAYAYAGYGVLLLAESYCTIAIDIGPELDRTAALTEAENRFTKAIAAAQAAGDNQVLNWARVGRARTRLDLAKFNGAVVSATKLTEAAADAALVPPGFVQSITFSTGSVRLYNKVFFSNNSDGSASVEDDFRGLTTGGVPDPRVPVVNSGRVGTDRITPLWVQLKYASLSAPIPVARYAEAQLIVAEAQGGATAVNIVNALRAAAGLPLYTGGTSAVEIQQLIISERARELFLESQHLGDKLRYGLAFTPAAGAPYRPPNSIGVVGNVTCIPVPVEETGNNPNF